MIYSLYIFNRHCVCIFHTYWNKPTPIPRTDSSDANTNSSIGLPGDTGTQPGGLVGSVDKQMEETAKLVYGVVFSLRNIIVKISPKQGDNFLSYRTNAYKLHYFESGTGLKFVLLTDQNMDSMVEPLRAIYSQIYVEYVSKNALLPADGPINNELFRVNLLRFVRTLPGFST